jgi:carbonic anhydrase
MMQSLQSTLRKLPGLLAVFLVVALSLCSAPVPAQSTGTNTSPAVPAVPVAAAKPAPAKLTPDQALERLLQGNQRYVAGKTTHPDQTAERRLGLANGQAPFAIILTCADSRVAPELFFDQGLGDLFVIRNAGNILDDHVIGSMEYAVEHLHAGLIVVVGHGQCGAVSAAVAGGEVPGHIRSVTEAIAPALEDARNLPGDKVDNAVRANAQRVAGILTHVEPFLKTATKEGHLKIVAARYDLSTGQVEILK